MPSSSTVTFIFEAEIAPGLEAIALDELRSRYSSSILSTSSGAGFVEFLYTGDWHPLLDLKTVNALYLLQNFDVPRPKALLGHQYFHTLLDLIHMIQKQHPANHFQTLSIDAAGSDSSVMQRLKAELAASAHLTPSASDDRGDLLLRLRRSRSNNGWDALIRLTPRPLATRPWRVQNYEGALNAAVAHAMIQLTRPTSEDVFLNLCCGSGTLLIERFAAGAAHQIIGCDLDPMPLAYAEANASAARVSPIFLESNARQLPFASASVNKLCADLPFGQLVGTHTENAALYPALLKEAARVARPDALFAIITHEIRLMESLLRQSSDWYTSQTYKITLNGLHPRIYLLKRI
jgi:23S rRNA G2445 N2-methylase RlmL